MGLIQRLFKAVLPSSAAAMEAESRAWMMQCPSCGHEVSVWDAGNPVRGIRQTEKIDALFKMRERTWHRTYKKTENQPPGSVKD